MRLESWHRALSWNRPINWRRLSGEPLALANGQSLVDNTTRYLQGNTTTTPIEKYNAKSSQGEVGRSDWWLGEDTMVTK